MVIHWYSYCPKLEPKPNIAEYNNWPFLAPATRVRVVCTHSFLQCVTHMAPPTQNPPESPAEIAHLCTHYMML